MRANKVLITGGAGFIGSFLTDELIKRGYSVRILDNLEEQVHNGATPKYLNKKAEFIHGDVTDYPTFEKALQDIDYVYHLAARVGIAQSNYEVKGYIHSNISGMGNLLDVVANKKGKIKKIIMTASMASYGEGEYLCKTDGKVKPDLRSEDQLTKKDWNIYCPKCHKKVIPVSTDENASINNNSIYSLTKNVQEELLMLIGKMYNIPVVSFRCFNVYGPRQSLSNPYTGVSAIFISRLKNNNAPVVYEDGLQSRDFISVHDVVNALILGLESNEANYQIMNLGTGNPVAVAEVARKLAKLLGKNIKPIITGEARKNDIRHCFADITKIQTLLSWQPEVSFEKGLAELIEWSEKENAVDLFDKSQDELRRKQLL